MNTSLSLSYPERTNLYINNINSENKNQIELLIKDGLISCRNDEDFYISIISFNTLYSFYQVIDGYNNNFAVIHNGIKTNYTIPFGNININTIIDYFNSIKNDTDIIITYDKVKNKFNFQKQNQNPKQNKTKQNKTKKSSWISRQTTKKARRTWSRAREWRRGLQ